MEGILRRTISAVRGGGCYAWLVSILIFLVMVISAVIVLVLRLWSR